MCHRWFTILGSNWSDCIHHWNYHSKLQSDKKQTKCGEETTDTTTRSKIIGVEVVGLGAFLLVLVLLELLQTHWNQVVQIAWIYTIVGITLILIGLETSSLARHPPIPVKPS